MSEEGFLSRWSRRKRAIEAGRPAPEPAAVAPPAAPTPAPLVVAEAPPFDIATLPPVDSLTLASDFTAFLRKEVPAALQRAALRRAWSLDPAIRDFVGPADYAWDYNAPDGVPGGSLELVGDVREMLAQVFGPEPAETDGAPETVPGGVAGVAPQGALTESLPQGALTESLPQGALTESLPQGALTESLPQGALTESLPNGAVTDNPPERGSIAVPPTVALSHVPPAGVLAHDLPTGAPLQPAAAPLRLPALLAGEPAPDCPAPGADPAASQPRRHGSALPS